MNSTSQNYLLNLNNQQKEAVIHTDGPLLILAGVDLGLHHDATGSVDLSERAFEFGGRGDRHALGHGDAELCEQFFGLVFVNVHEKDGA